MRRLFAPALAVGLMSVAPQCVGPAPKPDCWAKWARITASGECESGPFRLHIWYHSTLYGGSTKQVLGDTTAADHLAIAYVPDYEAAHGAYITTARAERVYPR